MLGKSVRQKKMWHLTLHRDGSVTYWSVYRQAWMRRVRGISVHEWESFGPDMREKIRRHFSKHKARRYEK